MIKNIYLKYKEQISYLFFGVITTVVNFIVYFALTNVFNINELVSNSFAWIASVLFAFVTNKLFVFDSKNTDQKTLVREVFGFAGARIVSFGIETVIMYIGINLLLINDVFVKVFTNVLVIIINYILSKLIVFKKK